VKLALYGGGGTKDLTVPMMAGLSIAMGIGGIGLILAAAYLATRRDGFLLQVLLQEHPVALSATLLCSLVLLVSLVVLGMLLLRRSERALRLMLWLYLVETVYFAVAALTTTASAFAAGNIGLFPQAVSAFPIWGFIVLWWASKQSMRVISPRKRDGL